MKYSRTRNARNNRVLIAKQITSTVNIFSVQKLSMGDGGINSFLSLGIQVALFGGFQKVLLPGDRFSKGAFCFQLPAQVFYPTLGGCFGIFSLAKLGCVVLCVPKYIQFGTDFTGGIVY